jgi:hypothetical protein
MLGQGLQQSGLNLLIVGAIAGVSAQELPGQPRQSRIDHARPRPTMSGRGPQRARGGGAVLCHVRIERPNRTVRNRCGRMATPASEKLTPFGRLCRDHASAYRFSARFLPKSARPVQAIPPSPGMSPAKRRRAAGAIVRRCAKRTNARHRRPWTRPSGPAAGRTARDSRRPRDPRRRAAGDGRACACSRSRRPQSSRTRTSPNSSTAMSRWLAP